MTSVVPELDRVDTGRAVRSPATEEGQTLNALTSTTLPEGARLSEFSIAVWGMRRYVCMPKTDLQGPIDLTPTVPPAGRVELILDGEHFQRVVRNGILKATTSLDIATANFKAMLVPIQHTRNARSIVKVFHELADRGVEIRLLHAGVPSFAAMQDLRKALPDRITIRRCPRLHAKAVIVDCAAMYLGSANLTGAGLGAKGDRRRNFELGVWTESAELIDGVLHHFNALWEGDHCEDCGRRDVCPVPLEEPALG